MTQEHSKVVKADKVVIFIFIAQKVQYKKYSRSFIKLRLNHWLF